MVNKLQTKPKKEIETIINIFENIKSEYAKSKPIKINTTPQIQKGGNTQKASASIISRSQKGNNTKKANTETKKQESEVKLDYVLADGSTVTLNVTPEFKKAYLLQVKKEKRIHRKETRRHISLEYLGSKNIELASNDKSPEDVYIEQEESMQIQKALSTLSKSEYHTLEQIAEGDFCYKTYARINNISIDAAYKRIARLKEKAQGLIAISKING